MSSCLARASEAMLRLADGLRDGGDGGEVAFRGHRESGLDNVHAQVLEGMGHGELFLGRHAAAGRLLAIAQSGVEERYVIGGLVCAHRLRLRTGNTCREHDIVSRIWAV